MCTFIMYIALSALCRQPLYSYRTFRTGHEQSIVSLHPGRYKSTSMFFFDTSAFDPTALDSNLHTPETFYTTKKTNVRLTEVLLRATVIILYASVGVSTGSRQNLIIARSIASKTGRFDVGSEELKVRVK